MTVVYMDSSAYVKLLVDEDGSDVAAALWDGCDAALCSRIGYPEVRAVLAAAGRDHRLEPAAQHRAERAWERYWEATRAVELTESLAGHAGELAGRHALRGADAIHLASALALGADDLIFAAWDRRLRTAVEAAGIRLGPRDLP
ncbi:MAG: type II toxin-antitoxin system VapC family toxin [Dermatophilaceae bacterium]